MIHILRASQIKEPTLTATEMNESLSKTQKED